ncbi:MAG: DUF2332 domain-containing protein [Acidimicrobiales bacterium]
MTALVAQPVLDALRFQRAARATSPLLCIVLDATLADIARGGPCAAVLARVDPALDPIADAVTLRFLGAIHRVVLEGRAPELAAHYPSAGGTFTPDDHDGITEVFVATVAAHADEVTDGLRRPVQTNEAGRSAALLPGFLSIADSLGLPLRILEVGASAGLNLRWDRYRYEGGAAGSVWGHESSALRFTDVYSEPAPDLAVAATVAERRGCDANPIDANTAEGRLTLRSFIWPDQPERHATLEAALAIAAEVPATVERADAGEWVEARLAEDSGGCATVVVHSIVWQYLTLATRRRILAALERAGAAATREQPLAWLRMEPGADFAKAAEVTLTTWPGGDERLLARSGYHGRPVRMVGGGRIRPML